MKFKNIVRKSKKIIKYVRKNHELPDSMDKATVLYLLSRSVNEIGVNKKVVRVKNVKLAKTKPVNIVLSRKDYILLSSYINTYMKDNKHAPDFIPFHKIDLSVDLIIYVFAKIIYSYGKNKKLPNKITCDSSIFTKPVKKYGRSTQTGCDNRGQNNGYYCAPHMVQEIIRNLTGKVIPQSTLAGIIGTTTSGSSHSGIDTSFAWFNRNSDFELEIEWKNFGDIGWNGIKKILESQNQDCGLHELYRDKWGHYTNFDKVYDNSIDVHNSLGNYCTSNCYCGYTENRTKTDAKRYLNGISQKSVLVVTRVK